ncbi:MAG: hypothetical protein PHE79_12050 [Eubacteriales bacterium]|nr:hypothetical protein [Eubacteriales bacterium]
MKSHKTDEFDRNYIELYAAIYKQAVADDIREVRRQVYKVLSLRRINEREIHRYLDRMEKEIEVQVQQGVYEEAQNYGPGTKRIQTKHINSLVSRLVDEYIWG